MSSPLAGAEMTTFLAPAARCLQAESRSVKRPVLSSTRSTPRSRHGSFSGSFTALTRIVWPLTTSASSRTSTVPGKRPCTESYFRRCASVWGSVMSFTAANSTAFCFISTAARTTFLPMRPNPLSPTHTAMHRSLSGEVRNDGPAERDGHDGPRAGGFQGPGGGREGRTRREDVVHKNERGTRKWDRGTVPRSEFRVPHLESPRHI